MDKIPFLLALLGSLLESPWGRLVPARIKADALQLCSSSTYASDLPAFRQTDAVIITLFVACAATLAVWAVLCVMQRIAAAVRLSVDCSASHRCGVSPWAGLSQSGRSQSGLAPRSLPDSRWRAYCRSAAHVKTVGDDGVMGYLSSKEPVHLLLVLCLPLCLSDLALLPRLVHKLVLPRKCCFPPHCSCLLPLFCLFQPLPPQLCR